MHDERAAAPVLLITCSDHRTTRSSDVKIIEEEVDALAARHGLVPQGQSVEFDELRLPGPQGALADMEDAEASVLMRHADLLLDVHGGELVILAFHVGSGDESGCAREGERHNDWYHVQGRAFRAVEKLKGRFPRQSFEVMRIEVANGRTVLARVVSESR